MLTFLAQHLQKGHFHSQAYVNKRDTLNARKPTYFKMGQRVNIHLVIKT